MDCKPSTVFLSFYRVPRSSMLLRVSPWVHRACVLHAISLISMKLGQFKGSTPKLKWQTGSLFRSLWWEIAHPTGLITFFSNKSALITDKSRKPSGQQFLTFYLEGLYIYWYIINKCKDVSFSQFDWQLVNYWPWIWDQLFSHSNICWFWDQISLLARKL